MQRLPSLLNEVHRFIEEKGLRFVLCGSSERKLKQAGVNLLAGRALYRAMHPFIPEELGERFALDDALQHGLLPIVWDSEDRAETLLCFQLPAYETRLRVRERKLPKWYWCDPGIVRAGVTPVQWTGLELILQAVRTISLCF